MSFGLALGVLIGNWILIPLIDRKKTYVDSLIIGVVAAILVFVFTHLFPTTH